MVAAVLLVRQKSFSQYNYFGVINNIFLDSKSRSNRVAYVYYYSTILGMYQDMLFRRVYMYEEYVY